MNIREIVREMVIKSLEESDTLEQLVRNILREELEERIDTIVQDELD